jgi:hypothetical protein
VKRLSVAVALKKDARSNKDLPNLESLVKGRGRVRRPYAATS